LLQSTSVQQVFVYDHKPD